MKKTTILVLAMIFLAGISEAQWNSNGNHIYNTNTGNVGIGTSTPGTLLDAAKNMSEPAISVRNLGGTGGATYRMYDQMSNADWKFKATNTGGFKIRDNQYGLDVIQIEANSESNMIYINAAGQMGIGTTTIGAGTKLKVPGKIVCQEIEVTLTSPSGNPVFDEDYSLMTLSELESFIKQEKHLPGVPLADEMFASGSNVGEMVSILLQKVEELTLYVIELKKENEKLKSKIE
jgi:hypothetical protein